MSISVNHFSLTKRIVFFLIPFAGFLILAELVTRLFLPRPGFQPYPSEQPAGLLIPHPERGYAYAANFVGEIQSEDSVISIRTNELGLRDISLDSLQKIRIMAAGNSFTVGFGVERSEAWPYQLAKEMNISGNVLNAGVSGYGMKQIRQLIAELSPVVAPETLIVGVYASRYWRVNSPYTYFKGMAIGQKQVKSIRLLADGMLVRPFQTTWIRNLDLWLNQYLYFPAYALKAWPMLKRRLIKSKQQYQAPTQQDLRPIVKPLLNELSIIAQLASKRNVKLYFLLVNHQEPDGRFSQLEQNYSAAVLNYADSLGIPCINPTPALQNASGGKPIFRFRNDHHWSAAAHQLVAKEILKAISAQ